jgi:hypothetical protein
VGQGSLDAAEVIAGASRERDVPMTAPFGNEVLT